MQEESVDITMSAPGANERDLMASWLRANEVPVPPGLAGGAGGPGAGGVSGNAGSGPPPSVTRFNQLVKEWEDTKASTSLASFDPTEILRQVADLLEKVRFKKVTYKPFIFVTHMVLLMFQETDVYLSKDPDPFMDRHPSRVNPNCPFGQLLKTFFKKDQFVEALFNDYTRDNYWTRLGQV